MKENMSINDGRGKNWKTKREMADYYKCNIRTISKLMHRRILPFVKIGRFVRFDPVECDKAIERYKSKGLFDQTDGQL